LLWGITQSQLKRLQCHHQTFVRVSLIDCSTFGKGTSTIQNIEQIDRGYERIDERLRAIGAKIVRVE
jgi:UDP-N-acetylglucosamine enolpyruvyl transferase